MAICLAFLAFVLALVTTPALSSFLTKRNLTDQPDGSRKLHTRAVPRLGGVAVFSAFLITMAIGLFASLIFALGLPVNLFPRIAPALSIVFLLGLVDDLTPLSARPKLAFQTWAAMVAVMMGVRFGANAGASLEVTLLEGVLTVFWLVLCTNAFNLIDGMDGLAAGLGFIVALTIAFGGAHAGQTEIVLIGLALAGSLLGFLYHNFPPASIFLGDSGSLTLGFLLSCLAVFWSNQQNFLPAKIAPAIVFAVPLADVLLSIVRRLLAGRPIFSPDRDHVHHRLLRSGLGPRRSAFLLYAAAGFASLIAFVSAVFPMRVGFAAFAVFTCVAFLSFRRLNYVEFRALSTAIRHFSIARTMSSHITLGRFQEAIRATTELSPFWMAMKQACFDFGFGHVRLTWDGRIYEDHLPISRREDRTSLFFSINGENSLVVSGKFSPHQHAPAFGAFLETLLDELKVRSAAQLKTARVINERLTSKAASIAARQAS
jgi:UDP-GlcNAc:undecaprenyl-phosphate GlcNAc-1-phosphate transferase